MGLSWMDVLAKRKAMGKSSVFLPIKIGYVVHSIETPAAGTESQLIQLVKHLDRSRFEPFLCCLYKSKWIKDNFGRCAVFEVGSRAPLNPLSWPNIVNFAYFLFRQQVQIVHCFFRDGNIAGVVAGRLGRVPVIVCARRDKGYWHDRKEVAILKLLRRFVTRYLANSEDVRQHVCESEGIPLGKIDVIYNGVDLSRFGSADTRERRDAREVLGISHDALVVGVVTNLRPIKGIDILLKAVPSVTELFENLVVLVMGAGEEEKALKALVNSLGIQSVVRFMGLRSDIPTILKACDLGILPSKSESLSNSVIEYMASGLPVIATDVGGAREMVSSGENGILIPSGDIKELSRAMIQLLGDFNLRARMGQCSRRVAEKMFSLEQYVNSHQDYYLRILEEKVASTYHHRGNRNSETF